MAKEKNFAVVLVHVWNLKFIKSHFDPKTTYHFKDMNKKERSEACKAVIRRAAAVKTKITSIMKKHADSIPFIYTCCFDNNDPQIKGMSKMEWEPKLQDNIINHLKNMGIKKVYFAGLHADACIIGDEYYKMEHMAKAFDVALISDMSDPIVNFDIDDTKHKRKYTTYLKNKFPYSYCKSSDIF